MFYYSNLGCIGIFVSHAQAYSNSIIFSCRTTDNRKILLERRAGGVTLQIDSAELPPVKSFIPYDRFEWADISGTGDGGNSTVVCIKDKIIFYQISYTNLNHAPSSKYGDVVIFGEKIKTTEISCIPKTIRFLWDRLKWEARKSMDYQSNGIFCQY